ncbi:alpha 1,2 mannosyltransferase, partial [Coemansia sp. RSA 2607]
MAPRPRLLLVLVLLGALRVLFCLSPAYMHPDEFFQGVEVTASSILGIEGLRTWEFTSPQPVRSLTAIHILYGAPFVLVRLLRDHLGVPLTPRRLFFAGRLGACLGTFLADWSVWRVVRRAGGRAGCSAVLLASSAAALAFFPHAFANCAAAALLALCIDMLDCTRHANRLMLHCGVLGVVLALGTFAHATFPLFALPLALCVLPLGVRPTVYTALSALLTCVLLISLDSAYYGNLVITPLNNLRYNADGSNLALHGVHARVTHVLVSMPLVAGPLWVLFLRDLCTGRVRWDAATAVVAGVVALSMVRHQEPRFVLPTLPAVVIATWRSHRRLSRGFWIIWTMWVVVVVAVFAGVHQAGVVPATLRIARESVHSSVRCTRLPQSSDHLCVPDIEGGAHRVTTHVFAWQTFMPPRHLLVQPPDTQAHVVVHDLIGVGAREAGEVLRRMPSVSCASVHAGRLIVDGAFERTLLLVPASADIEEMGVSLQKVASDMPH